MAFESEVHVSNQTLDEHVFLRRHDSGLPVYFCPKPGFQKRYACFAARFGSIDASFRTPSAQRVDVPAGVAHFLEHKLFEGEDGNAFEKFSESGASSNAYTGFNVTNYLFSCSNSFFENLDRLISFVQEPFFTPENVEKEKGIIGQEIRMYEDDPGWQSYMNLLGALYHRHPIREDIAGSIESIAKIDKELLDTCYSTFYHPENMILFAVGDEDRDQFFDRVDQAMSRRSYEALGSIERIFPEEPDSVANPRVGVEMAISMPRVLIGFKDREAGVGGPELLVRELVSDILLEILFGEASPFYQRLYESELIDEGFGSNYRGYVEAGHSILSGKTPDPDRLAAEVLGEIERVRKTGVDEQDFTRQKRAVMGSCFRWFNSLEFIANNYCTYRFCDIDLFEIIDTLHRIDLGMLNTRLDRHFTEDAMAVSTVRPKSAVVS